MKYLICVFGMIGILGLAGCKTMEAFVPRTPLFGYNAEEEKAKNKATAEENKLKHQIDGFDFSRNDIFGVKPGIAVSDFDKSPDRRLNLKFLSADNNHITARYIHKKPYEINKRPNELVFVGTVGYGEDKTVYYIQRMNHYVGNDLKPLRKNLLETLVKKYGPPTDVINYGNGKNGSNTTVKLFWAYNKNDSLISSEFSKYVPKNVTNIKSRDMVDMYIEGMGYLSSPYEFPRFPERDLLMDQKIVIAAMSISDYSKSDCAAQREHCERMMSAVIKSSNKNGVDEVSYFGMTLADMKIFDQVKLTAITRMKMEEENEQKSRMEKQKQINVDL